MKELEVHRLACDIVEALDAHIVHVGDTIRFSAVLLEAMTQEDYPLVRIMAIRTADDGSKVIRIERL